MSNLIGYEVRGIPPGATDHKNYGDCQTVEGAEMLADEAARMGWREVSYKTLYRWERPNHPANG